MLKSLITYLNLKLDLLNYFDLTRCLVELKEDSEGTRQPVEYVSNGDYDVIDWDEFNGVSYWRLRDEITSDRTEERKYKAGARNNIETTVPLKLVFAVPRTKLTEDDAYSFDRIRQTMVKQFAIDDDVIKTTLQAESVRINVVTANSDAKEVWEEETESTGTFEPKYETVFGSIDVDVVIISKHSCLPTECDDVESDIIRSFDWCGNTAVTVGRLTPAQQTCISDFICSCADATVENSDGSYTNTVASGGTLVLPNITVTDSDGSTSSVPSVQDVTCTTCADATVQLNGIEVATPASGATVDIPVTQDGSPVGSWNGSAFIIPPCSGGGSISATVSDSAPSIGDTITITGTASNYTPDSYLFFAYDGTSELIFIAEQASNSFDWTIPSIDVGNYTIYVLGVENGTPDVTAYGTVDIAVSSSFLLDTPEGTGANFALAFFRLRAAFADTIATIRRSSDNAQESFFLDSNNVLSLLSETSGGTTLGDWIGANDGYLVSVNCQCVGGNTITAASQANQAMVVDAGVMVDLNGLTAIIGDDKQYSIASPVTFKSAFIVAQNTSLNTLNYLFSNDSPAQGLLWGGTFTSTTGIGMFDGTFVQTTVEDTNPHLATFLTQTGIYVDGNLDVSGTVSDITVVNVAGRNTIGLRHRGKISCIVSYATDKTADRATIEANINGNYSPSIL